MFGIFVHYSTRLIYDVSINLFCWPPSVCSVDIFNILPGFLWQPLLTRSVASLKLKLRSGYKAVDCSRTNKNAEWRSGESTRLPAHQCGPGSNPGVDSIHVCGLSLSLVLVLAPRGFSPCILVFPLLKNKHFQIPFRFSLLYLKIDLKGHSQLWDRADLDTSFASLKSVHLKLKLNVRVGYI